MLRPIQSLSDHEAQHEQMGLARLNEGLIVDIADLPSRPSAAVFGVGHAYIVTPTYRIKCTSDSVSWDSHGSSDSIAYRPSAALLGKGTWWVNRTGYSCNGKEYSLIGGAMEVEDDTFKGMYIDASTPTSIFMYLRYPWSATLDAVLKVRLSGAGSTFASSNPLDFQEVKTIPIATATDYTSVIAAFIAGAAVTTSTDSATPLNYNATYIGANHGALIAHAAVMTGHGKTTADIGSTWSGVARTFTIVNIVDANTLWVVANNTGTHDQWYFYPTLLTGVTLTHVSGATNTGDIVVASDTLAQFLSPMSRRSLVVKVNGGPIDITTPASATYTNLTSLVITEAYSINNPADTLAYMQANVGANPVPWSDNIFADVDVVNTFTFSSNGAVAVDQALKWHSAVNMGYIGAVQELALPFSGKTLSQFMNGVTAIGGVNYSVPVDISGAITAWSALQANWADLDNPPSRMAQIVSTTGVNEFGMVIGYSPLRGVTTRRLRKTYTNNAGGQLSAASKKQYIKAVSGSNPAVGETYTISAFRHVYNSSQVPDATVATWFIDGDAVVVIMDFHKISALSSIALPPFCDGRSVSIASSNNVKLLSSVVNNKVDVECTASTGNAVLIVK